MSAYAAKAEETAEDAITAEEMAIVAPPGTDAASTPAIAHGNDNAAKQNAFTKLMSSSARKDQPASPPKKKIKAREPVHSPVGIRGGLGIYTLQPEDYGPDRVISYDDDFVVIRDLFPKASVHFLILPRDKSRQLLHPFDAFDTDPEVDVDGSTRDFLAKVQKKALEVKRLAAAELRRMYGADSAADKPRREAILNADESSDANEPLPKGRDWEKEIKAGIHARPSMAHLHVHVISREMHSPHLKHRKHFNSFTTPFLVDVADFPLAADDERRHPTDHGYLRRPLCCQFCGKDFGEKFFQLKPHLEEEFKKWKVT